MDAIAARPYPVRVSARRDARLSRWLWLVKWLLAIPHFVILVFLWVAFVVLTAIAGVSIALTARYPAALFDFNVGVLRWTWRVQHYCYGALGTDRYPPFTLAEVPDYPAHLEVERPQRLSRGLVLVKWWLLAIPHYVIVALFIGGLGPIWDGPDGPFRWFLGGLIGILVLAAGIVLAATGRYPGPVYDVAVGMDRWVLQVAAYAGLMTDAYPPFRLDLGGTEPAPPADETPDAPPADRPAERARTGWTALRVAAVIAGATLTLAGTGALAGGGVMLWADQTQRTDGLLTTPERQYHTATYALATDRIGLPDVDLGWFGRDSVLGRVRVEVVTDDTSPRFVGIGRATDVARYLDGVSYAKVSDLTGHQQPVEVAGTRAPVAPIQAGIWAASVSGPGTQTLTWRSTGGDWTVVVMRPDGSAGVDGAVHAAAEVPILPWLAGATLGLGGLLLLIGILLIVVPVVRAAHRDNGGGVAAAPTN